MDTRQNGVPGENYKRNCHSGFYTRGQYHLTTECYSRIQGQIAIEYIYMFFWCSVVSKRGYVNSGDGSPNRQTLQKTFSPDSSTIYSILLFYRVYCGPINSHLLSKTFQIIEVRTSFNMFVFLTIPRVNFNWFYGSFYNAASRTASVHTISGMNFWRYLHAICALPANTRLSVSMNLPVTPTAARLLPLTVSRHFIQAIETGTDFLSRRAALPCLTFSLNMTSHASVIRCY